MCTTERCFRMGKRNIILILILTVNKQIFVFRIYQEANNSFIDFSRLFLINFVVYTITKRLRSVSVTISRPIIIIYQYFFLICWPPRFNFVVAAANLLFIVMRVKKSLKFLHYKNLSYNQK